MSFKDVAMFSLRRASLLFAALAVPFSAGAQKAPGFHCYTLSGGAGYSAMAAQDGSNHNGEWDVQAGAGVALVNETKTRHWSFFLNFDYLFDHASVKSSALSEAKNLNSTNIALLNATGGTTRFQVVALDPTVRVRVSKRADFYLFGGFGWFHRQVDLTGVANQGSLLQPGNPSVFLRNASSGSLDAGGGINFKPKKGWAMPYVEIRVVHGLAVNKSTTLVPVAAGIRW